jgi:UDP-N-acetylglucosamine 2-epimerase (non-hydrolysing)
MRRMLCVAAARPNFMKVKPVIDELERRGTAVTLVHTGQHYDPLLSDIFFEELGLREPDWHLGVGSGSHAQQTAGVMTALEPVVAQLVPDTIVVVGDVNSTLAASIVAAKAGVRLAHVEAGLRSGDWSMPEEVNRVVTDRLSDVLLAPSPDAVDNLLAEGRTADDIHLVGNVMVDTLLANLDRALARPTVDAHGLDPKSYALVTLHRPSNVDDAAVLARLLDVLAEVATRLAVLFPIHPRARRLVDHIGLPPGVRGVDPLGYLDFVALEANAAVVLTDSGGVQEETTVLGVPCLTIRDNTERPITVEQGTNEVVGRDPQRILAAVDRALHGRVEARRPELWDGRAADRIAEVLLGS